MSNLWCLTIFLLSWTIVQGSPGILNRARIFVDEEMSAMKTHLEYMGSFQRPMGIFSGGRTAQSHYFKSQNAAGYSISKEDCRNFLGPDASLLSIESDEELAAVNAFLQGSDDTGSTYWLGAGYDVDSDKFLWETGGDVDATLSSAPWDNGYPDTYTPVTKVIAFTVGNLKLRTRFSTVSTRYICEIQIGSGTPSTTTTRATTTTTTSTTTTTTTTEATTSSTETPIPTQETTTTEKDPETTTLEDETTTNDDPETTEPETTPEEESSTTEDDQSTVGSWSWYDFNWEE